MLTLAGLVLGMILRFSVVCSSADQVDESLLLVGRAVLVVQIVSFKLSG